MELQAVQDKIAVGVLEQWHEKQLVGRWARKRREMYGRRFWKRERLVNQILKTRCRLEGRIRDTAEKDQEAGVAAQFRKGRKLEEQN